MTVFRAAVAARHTVTSPTCELSSTARLLWFVLAAYVDTDGRCNPSVPTLATAVNGSERTVRRARAELVDAGAITVQTGGGRTTRNVYRLPMSTVPAAARPGARSRPQPGHRRPGLLSTTRSLVTTETLNPVTGDHETRSPVTAEVDREVGVSKRSAPQSRRRMLFRSPVDERETP